MKSKVQSVVTLDMTGEELDDLCKLLMHARCRLEQFNDELIPKDSSPSRETTTVRENLRLIEVSKQYTNLRAQIR